jgi:hypothetical protein
MTYLVSPEMELEIDGKSYTLSPSVECLKKIQHAMKMDIIDVIDGAGGVIKVHFQDHARMIHIAIEDGGQRPPKIEEIEKWIVDEIGITAIRNIMQGWLLIVTQPKREREAMQKQVGESLKALGLGSLGGNIKSSA